MLLLGLLAVVATSPVEAPAGDARGLAVLEPGGVVEQRVDVVVPASLQPSDPADPFEGVVEARLAARARRGGRRAGDPRRGPGAGGGSPIEDARASEELPAPAAPCPDDGGCERSYLLRFSRADDGPSAVEVRWHLQVQIRVDDPGEVADQELTVRSAAGASPALGRGVRTVLGGSEPRDLLVVTRRPPPQMTLRTQVAVGTRGDLTLTSDDREEVVDLPAGAAVRLEPLPDCPDPDWCTVVYTVERNDGGMVELAVEEAGWDLDRADDPTEDGRIRHAVLVPRLDLPTAAERPVTVAVAVSDLRDSVEDGRYDAEATVEVTALANGRTGPVTIGVAGRTTPLRLDRAPERVTVPFRLSCREARCGGEVTFGLRAQQPGTVVRALVGLELPDGVGPADVVLAPR